MIVMDGGATVQVRRARAHIHGHIRRHRGCPRHGRIAIAHDHPHAETRTDHWHEPDRDERAQKNGQENHRPPLRRFDNNPSQVFGPIAGAQTGRRSMRILALGSAQVKHWRYATSYRGSALEARPTLPAYPGVHKRQRCKCRAARIAPGEIGRGTRTRPLAGYRAAQSVRSDNPLSAKQRYAKLRWL